MLHNAQPSQNPVPATVSAHPHVPGAETRMTRLLRIEQERLDRFGRFGRKAARQALEAAKS